MSGGRRAAPGEPPLFVDAFELARWLLTLVHDDPRPLAVGICSAATELAERVALAAKGFDRAERLAEADELLVMLRLRVRWGTAVGVLTEAQALHAADRMLEIGRQIGAWRRYRNARRDC